MFEMDEDFVSARLSLLGAQIGLPTMLQIVDSDNPIRVWTEQELDDCDHDLNLLKKHLIGREKGVALTVFEKLRPEFLSVLKDVSVSEFVSAFG